jgi:hypothetical protein
MHTQLTLETTTKLLKAVVSEDQNLSIVDCAWMMELEGCLRQWMPHACRNCKDNRGLAIHLWVPKNIHTFCLHKDTTFDYGSADERCQMFK